MILICVQAIINIERMYLKDEYLLSELVMLHCKSL